jgi:hypothetical protein
VSYNKSELRRRRERRKIRKRREGESERIPFYSSQNSLELDGETGKE